MIGLSIISFVGVTILILALSTSHEVKVDRLSTPNTDYFFGGRTLTWPLLSGSLLMTHLTIQTLMEFSGYSYVEGYLVAILWEWTAVLAIIFSALYILPRHLANGSETIFGFLEQRVHRSTYIALSTFCCFIYILVLLPTLLYTGSQALMLIFELPISPTYLIVGMGFLGGWYTIFGDLKSIMLSDTFYAVGFLMIALSLPLMGLNIIGEGSALTGFNTLLDQHASFFSPYAIIKNTSVSTPFTSGIFALGLLGFQIFYWSANQVTMQRAMSTRSLADGQKGLLGTAGIKLFMPFLLGLPALLAFHLMSELSIPIHLPSLQGLIDQSDLPTSESVQLAQDIVKSGASRISLDTAESLRPLGFTFTEHIYSSLLRRIMPNWSLGLLATILVGLVISTFNSLLHSAATIFCFDVYAPSISTERSDGHLVFIAKTFCILTAIIAIILALYLSQRPSYIQYIQSIALLYGLPIVSICSLAFFTPKIVSAMTYWIFALSLIAITYLAFYPVHQLYWPYAFCMTFILLGFTAPWVAHTQNLQNSKPTAQSVNTHVIHLEPWVYRNHISICLVISLIVILCTLLWISH